MTSRLAIEMAGMDSITIITIIGLKMNRDMRRQRAMNMTEPQTDNPQALVRLMTWLSPAFPVGAFSYSHGIERAVHDGLIGEADDLKAWLFDLLTIGSAWNDSVLLAEAWRLTRRGAPIDDLADLAEAMAGSRERHRETMAQGEAFLASVRHAYENATAPQAHPDRLAYPLAVGVCAARDDLALQTVLAAYLNAFVINLVQVGMRIVPLGQSDGLRVISSLESDSLAVAARAASSSLADLGSATFVSEIMSLRHETQYARLFRS